MREVGDGTGLGFSLLGEGMGGHGGGSIKIAFLLIVGCRAGRR